MIDIQAIQSGERKRHAMHMTFIDMAIIGLLLIVVLFGWRIVTI